MERSRQRTTTHKAEANRFYYLRRKQGFSDQDLAKLTAGWETWCRWVARRIADRDMKGVEYVFYEPRRSDRKTVTIPIGGEETYPAIEIFEEDVPIRYFIARFDKPFLNTVSVRRDGGGDASYFNAYWLPAVCYLESPGVWSWLRSNLYILMLGSAGPPWLRWIWSLMAIVILGVSIGDTYGALRGASDASDLSWGQRLFLVAFGLFCLRAAVTGWQGYRYLKRQHRDRQSPQPPDVRHVGDRRHP